MLEGNFKFTQRFEKLKDIEKQSCVFQALDNATGEKVVIKRWNHDSPRGINEIAQRSKLLNEHIAPFICSFEEDDYRYMVCRWAEGNDLEQYIGLRGLPDEAKAVEIFYQICQILVYFARHELGPLVFNDLKPENLIVNEDKDGKISVWLVDFETCLSLSANADDDFETFETLPLGSAFFTAPEVLEGKISKTADVYSAGAILGYMLFGKDFCRNAEEFLSRKEDNLVKILRDCMNRDEPERRISPTKLLENVKKYIKTGDYEEIPIETEKEKGDIGEKKENVKTAVNSHRRDMPVIKKNEKNVQNDFIVAGKLSICCDENLCFATELAYACSENFKMKTLLVDSFVLRNRISLFMLGNMVFESNENKYGAYGIDACIFGDRDMWFQNGYIGKTDKNQYLDIGTKELQEEIFRDKEKLEIFYRWAYKNYDAIIVNLYKNTDESVREEVLRLFNYVVVAANPNIDEIESLCDHYTELSKQGKVYRKNVKYVAWDYVENQSLPEKGIRCLIGDDRYLGAISYENERYKMRNINEKPEFYGENKAVKEEYKEIITKMLFGGE